MNQIELHIKNAEKFNQKKGNHKEDMNRLFTTFFDLEIGHKKSHLKVAFFLKFLFLSNSLFAY